MLSSTFSSEGSSAFQRRSVDRMHHTANDRLPRGSWNRIGVRALLLTLLFLAVWEGLWRARGFKPELSDDADLWAWTRQRATEGGTTALVFIGSSRGQLDVNLQTVEQETGIMPVQLSINGASPLPVLEDLAADPQFRGTIICDVEERHLFPQAPGHEDNAVRAPRRYVRHFHDQNAFKRFEFALKQGIEQNTVFHLPQLTPLNVMQKWRHKRWPRHSYLGMNADRSRPANYQMVDIVEHRKIRISYMTELYKRDAPPSVTKLRQSIAQMRPWIKAIRQRGGEVLFVHLPMSGNYWKTQEKLYPKNQYWDVFAREIGALALYFSDVPALKNFNCPDGSHLDKRDTERFTRALLKTLRPLSTNPVFKSTNFTVPQGQNFPSTVNNMN